MTWEGAVDILQLRPLTVLPILDEFPMSIVQNPLLSSDVRKVARSEITRFTGQAGFFVLKLFNKRLTKPRLDTGTMYHTFIYHFPKAIFAVGDCLVMLSVCGPFFGQSQ